MVTPVYAGWKDLFVARSNVMDNVSEVSDRRYPEPNSVFRNLGGGKFEEIGALAGPDFQLEAAHRGVAFGDLDNDGLVDMVVSVLGGPAKLFRNISGGVNHWILLKLVGGKSNRLGIGAQLHLTTEDGRSQWNEVTTAVGYTSSSDSRVHFGLGPTGASKRSRSAGRAASGRLFTTSKWTASSRLRSPNGSCSFVKFLWVAHTGAFCDVCELYAHIANCAKCAPPKESAYDLTD